jgi:hypothetical protein
MDTGLTSKEVTLLNYPSMYRNFKDRVPALMALDIIVDLMVGPVVDR